MWKTIVVTQLMVQVVAYHVEFNPKVVNAIPETQFKDVRVYLSNCTSDELESLSKNVSARQVLGDPADVSFPASITGVTCCYNDSIADCGSKTKLEGLLLSYNEIEFCTAEREECRKLGVGVIRPPEAIKDKLFLISAMVITVFYTMCFGAMLDLAKVKQYFKRPIGPALGIVGQFIIMPVIAYALTWTIEEDKSLEFGIFATGVTPGGGGSNIWAYLLGGDLDLSITMTLLSTIGSLAFVPLWMLTLGAFMLKGSKIGLPFIGILQTLALVVIPIAVGLLINRFLPKLAKILYTIQRYTVGVAMVYMNAIGLWANWYAFVMVFSNYRLALILVFYPIAGAVVGMALSWVCRQTTKISITVGIETAVQNSTVATILLKTTLPPPWSDISSAFAVCLILYSSVPLIVLGGIRLGYLLIKHTCSITAVLNRDEEKEQEYELRDEEKAKQKETNGKYGKSDDMENSDAGVDNPTMIKDDENSNAKATNGHGISTIS